MRDPESAVGARIAAARRSRGMTQAALATRSSLDRTALAKVESGRRRVSSAELGRISGALGMPAGAFLEDEPSPDEGITIGTLRRRRKAILRVAAQHGARGVLVFGSVARGEASSGSDVDLLVGFEPGRSLLDQAALLIDLRRLLGREVDVVTLDGLRDDIRERIASEAVPL